MWTLFYDASPALKTLKDGEWTRITAHNGVLVGVVRNNNGCLEIARGDQEFEGPMPIIPPSILEVRALIKKPTKGNILKARQIMNSLESSYKTQGLAPRNFPEKKLLATL